MQLYLYDRVQIKENVVDEQTDTTEEKFIDLSGMSGVVTNIGYRSDIYPITVDIYNPDTGFYEECMFKIEELEVVL